MNTVCKSLSVIALVTFVSGCASTGGSVGGFFPAPKFLKGDIENNVYTSKDKRFTVSIPHQMVSYEYKYMKVKEQYKENGVYVSFGPAAYNYSIYRYKNIVYPKGIKNTVSMNTVAHNVIEDSKKKMLEMYDTHPTVLEKSQIKINGHKAYHWRLQQTIPSGKSYSNQHKVFNHYIYVVDYDKSVGIFWVRIPSDTGKRHAGITPLTFVESLRLIPNKINEPTSTSSEL